MLYFIIEKVERKYKIWKLKKRLGDYAERTDLYVPDNCIIVGGKKHIRIGSNFYANESLRIEAITEWAGQKYSPKIEIGNNFACGREFHIGAINRIEIGNDVLVGSMVLITDHFHGKAEYNELQKAPNSRRLYSKGEVIIGDNVLIGDGVKIMPGVEIGNNAIIGANAVVTHNIPENCVAVGIPAEIVKKLDDNTI